MVRKSKSATQYSTRASATCNSRRHPRRHPRRCTYGPRYLAFAQPTTPFCSISHQIAPSGLRSHPPDAVTVVPVGAVISFTRLAAAPSRTLTPPSGSPTGMLMTRRDVSTGPSPSSQLNTTGAFGSASTALLNSYFVSSNVADLRLWRTGVFVLVVSCWCWHVREPPNSRVRRAADVVGSDHHPCREPRRCPCFAYGCGICATRRTRRCTLG